MLQPFKDFITGKAQKYIYDTFNPQDDTRLVECRQNPDNQAAIIFIHGFTGDAEDTWGKFDELLKDEEQLKGWNIYQYGYNSKFTPDIKGLWACNPDITMLAENVRTQLTENFGGKYRQIALVAHSMGGLICQRAVLDIMQTDKQATLIHSLTMYGTPSGGLKKAELAGDINQQVLDMAESGEFIAKLRKEWDEIVGDNPPFKLMVCRGGQDQFVPPKSSVEPFPSQFRQYVNGNHLNIVKPENKQSISFLILRNLLLDKDSFYKGKYDSADIAVQLGDFKWALEELTPRKDNLQSKEIVSYALALEATGDRATAIDYLKVQAKKGDSDILGTLAGRYKRLYLAHSRDEDLNEAQELHEKAYAISIDKNDVEQIFYHAINLAYVHLKKNDKTTCEKYARIASENAAVSKNIEQQVWKYATLAEANLYLEDEANAYYHYMDALEKVKELWQKDSMQNQWFDITNELGLEKLKKRLVKLFRED